MKRVGIFTGHIYDENISVEDIHECCMTVHDYQLFDKIYMAEILARQRLSCLGCKECEESRKPQSAKDFLLSRN